ncbi:MAG: carbonate dehydratase [Verrucomicrobia bacterium]|nr:carbonate dehydratase [Verrucomicrobiota bacterium]
MKELEELFYNNKKWATKRTKEDPAYFQRMSKVHEPLYMWIGCSDSRVPANEIIGLDPGELFVHRNVANLFPNIDLNCLSALEFAVGILKIKHVIVCGHYGCNGVEAAMQHKTLGLADNWLRNIRDVYARTYKELVEIEDRKLRSNRLVELNVIQQVHNICHTTIVQEGWRKKQPLYIHGWVYDISTGLLKDLNCCISNIDQLEDIYRI